MKLSGTLYDDMTDSEGNPIPKPTCDFGKKRLAARAARNKINLRKAAQNVCGLFALFIQIKFE
jgi:hypothetical protein